MSVAMVPISMRVGLPRRALPAGREAPIRASLPSAAVAAPLLRISSLRGSAILPGLQPRCPSSIASGRVIRNRRAVQVKAKEDSSRSAELGDTAKANLRNAAENCKRLGWISFWTQLVLSSVSIVILLFSVAFSNTTNPTPALYMALFGVLAGFVSTLWAFRYTRLGRSIRLYLESKEGLLPPDEAQNVKKISKLEVLRSMNWGAFINLLGMGTSIVALQATVGGLVAKTLTNATANPFLSSGAGSYNPVLALDVFLVQGLTNTLLSHFAGLVFSMWLARSIDSSSAIASSSRSGQVSFSS